DAPVAERQVVVVIAADLSRRFAMRRYRQAFDLERPLRPQRHLDLPVYAQLLLEALLLRLLLKQILHAGGHRVERIRQIAELVVAVNGDAMGEIATPHMLGAARKLVHRAGDRPRQLQTHHERDALNREEESTDDRQEDEQ